MVLATQAFTLFFVMTPFLSHLGLSPLQNELVFIAVGLASVLIAAGGYVINDYYDVEIDKANGVSVIVGDRISNTQTLRFYFILNVIGVLVGIAAGVMLENIWFAVSFLFIAFFLWIYSRWLKKTLLTGNFLVAVLSAYPVLIMLLAVSMIYPESIKPEHEWLMMKYFVLGYAFFAFATHFLREVIKDIQDYTGDKAFGAQTLPMVIGKKSTVHVCIAFIMVIMILLLYAQTLLFINGFLFIPGYLLLVQVLFVHLLAKLRKAKGTEDFHRASTEAKSIMLAGISSMILIPFVL